MPATADLPPSIARPVYNEANLLGAMHVRLHGASADEETTFVRNIDYNARGQRELIEYGNDVTTSYTYDDETFRLTLLRSTRPAAPSLLQELHYTYDPVGNITEVRDEAQQTVFFENSVVSPSARYAYDALYRLIFSAGREHARSPSAPQPDELEIPRYPIRHPNDLRAVHRYEERYAYDGVGNILEMTHRAMNGADPQLNWTRRYQYETASNRLRSTSLPGDDPVAELNSGGTYSARYPHDSHGNITSMPHLSEMAWDFKDRLVRVDLGGGGTVHFVYDAAGQRVRKVHEHNGALVDERIYFGGYELLRRRDGSGPTRERETLHVMDGEQRIALVETLTLGDTRPVGGPTPTLRYQLANHLGSACMELSEDAAILSYEEFHPFGTTAYHSARGIAEVSLKRYRHIGTERDQETALDFCSARYCAAWLGRWCSPDPLGLADGVNRYAVSQNRPTVLVDPSGTEGETGELEDDRLHLSGERQLTLTDELPSPADFRASLGLDDPVRDTSVESDGEPEPGGGRGVDELLLRAVGARDDAAALSEFEETILEINLAASLLEPVEVDLVIRGLGDSRRGTGTAEDPDSDRSPPGTIVVNPYPDLNLLTIVLAFLGVMTVSIPDVPIRNAYLHSAGASFGRTAQTGGSLSPSGSVSAHGGLGVNHYNWGEVTAIYNSGDWTEWLPNAQLVPHDVVSGAFTIPGTVNFPSISLSLSFDLSLAGQPGRDWRGAPRGGHGPRSHDFPQ